MSCIAGRRNEFEVVIAADCATTTDNTQVLSTDKLFSHKGVLYGICGTAAACNAFHYGLKLPKSPARPLKDPVRWAYEKIAVPLQKLFEERSIAKDELSALIGVHNKLITFNSPYDLWESSRGFDAVGSGANYALTALHLGYGVVEAVKSAEEFDPDVRGPVMVMSTEVL